MDKIKKFRTGMKFGNAKITPDESVMIDCNIYPLKELKSGVIAIEPNGRIELTFAHDRVSGSLTYEDRIGFEVRDMFIEFRKSDLAKLLDIKAYRNNLIKQSKRKEK
jgi:hypothetical protein